MREVNKVKVIDALPAHFFEKTLQETLDEMAAEGFKTEVTIEITTSRMFMAVLVGKRAPFMKPSTKPIHVETKVELGSNVGIELDGRTIARGTMAYSNGLDYKREHEEKLPKFLKEMQADKTAMDFYKHGTLPSQQDKEQK